MLSREWRCSWSSADRRCSSHIWVINNFIANHGASAIRGFTVIVMWSCNVFSFVSLTTITWHYMMTSSNGNIYPVTGPLWPVISRHKGRWREALVFSFDLRLNKRLSKQSWGWWFVKPLRPLWRHCNDKGYIVTSWHGKYLRIIDPLWEEFPSQRPSKAKLSCFLFCKLVTSCDGSWRYECLTVSKMSLRATAASTTPATALLPLNTVTS